MKTIIEMAREAGLPEAWISETGVLKWSDLERFAELVRADERELVLAAAIDGAEHAARKAIADEREACAKLCEELHPGLATRVAAEHIRARGNT